MGIRATVRKKSSIRMAETKGKEELCDNKEKGLLRQMEFSSLDLA